MNVVRTLTVLGIGGLLALASPAARAQTAVEAQGLGKDADADVERVSEYRTDETTTWIRLSPFVGALWSSDKLDLSTGAMFGFEAALEPQDLLTAFIELGIGVGVDRENQFTDGTKFFDTEGTAVHAALYVGLFNPELRSGGLQAILGLGVGAFIFTGYDVTVDDPQNPGNDLTLKSDDAYLFHASIFTRLDVAATDHLHFGLDVKLHLPLYAQGAPVGELTDGSFGFEGIMLQPALYLSLVF